MIYPWVEVGSGKYLDLAIKIGLLTAMVCATGFARAQVAVWFGDQTPKAARQLTLAPAAHFSLWSTALFPGLFLWLFSGAWTMGSGKPVASDMDKLSEGWGLGRLLTTLAQPLTGAALGFATLGMMIGLIPIIDLQSSDTTYKVLQIFCYFCLFHAMFHALPFPPFGGAEVVRFVLPGQWLKRTWDWLSSWIGFLFFILILLSWMTLLFQGGPIGEMGQRLQPAFQRIGELFLFFIQTVDRFIDGTFLHWRMKAG